MNIDWKPIVMKLYETGSVWGLRLIGGLVLLLVGRMVVSMLNRTCRNLMLKAKLDETLVGFLGTIIHVSLIVLLWLMVLGQLGVQTTSFIAVVGAAGLAIGLALQGTLANVGAGVLLIAFRPFQVGHWIEGGGIAGTVKEIGIFQTIITTGDNKVIIVPNARLTGDSITNFSVSATRRVDLVFGISYGDSIDRAREIIASEIAANELILRDPEPMIVVSSLGDSSVNITVRVWVNTPDYWKVNFAMLERVKKAFDAGGVVIPFPQTDVHLHQA